MEVEFFDSLEEAQARLHQAMEAADARVRPWQAAVKIGDCFIADGGEEGLPVFGEVLEAYAEPHLRHYRLCRCYSVACPEGEVGDVHVSTILCRVSRAFFEAMRQAGWRMEAGQRPRSACRTMEGGGRPFFRKQKGVFSRPSSTAPRRTVPALFQTALQQPATRILRPCGTAPRGSAAGEGACGIGRISAGVPSRPVAAYQRRGRTSGHSFLGEGHGAPP